MKVLLVEDQSEKASLVVQTLREALGERDAIIDLAENVIDAVKKLEAQSYDLMVLDLVLPQRNGRQATPEGGKAILAEIVDGTGLFIPAHIICLTAFEHEAAILADEINKSLVHLVLYSDTGTSWREGLCKKARLIEKRVLEATGTSRPYDYDLLIVTSSPLVELSEIRKLPGDFVAEYCRRDQQFYYTAEWITITGRCLRVVACAAPAMGMTAACVTAYKGIERWRPRYVAMSGIAAGTDNEVHLGDILCAESVYDYGSGKILENPNGKRTFVPSPQQLPVDPGLQSILRHWEREQLGVNGMPQEVSSKRDGPPRLILGMIATGSAVVQSAEMVSEIKSSSRKTVGLDMEAYAIFQACHLCSLPRPKALVAKAISDFADKDKGDSWQQYAACASAHFLYKFFTEADEVWQES